MEPWASQGQSAAESDCGMSSSSVPSPQSEAVTHDMEESSSQPTQSSPPLNERKNVSQSRLQQRRTREQSVDQGIMPPSKSPAAFHGQIRSSERARTENFSKHKIRSRPERAESVRMHISQETGAEPSSQATQMKSKRARSADNSNEKIAQRPGPMESVEKNISPVDSSSKEAIIVGQVNYPKVSDEDSLSDAVSPEQPASQESQSSAPSPGESRVSGTPPPAPAAAVPAVSTRSQPLPAADFSKAAPANEQPLTCTPVHPAPPITTAAATPSKPAPTSVKQSQQKTSSEKSRSKKGKEAKSRVRKSKYHQYVPPDQKQEASEAPMDSSYARSSQQQQLFSQSQISSQQQQQHYNYQTILPAPLKPAAEAHSSGGVGASPTSIVVSSPTPPPAPPPAPPRANNSSSNRKPGVSPANSDEMKVAESKSESKSRGLPVSGTKTDSIERSKPFQENAGASAPPAAPASTPSVPMEVSTTTAPAVVLPVQQVAPEATFSTPPNSPVPLEQDVSMSEAPSELRQGGSGSPQRPSQVPEEKDRRSHEKERQIEESMRKSEQEQRSVEESKMQSEVEKRGQADPASPASPSVSSAPAISTPGAVKPEGPARSACSSSALPTLSAPPHPQVVKSEDVTVSARQPSQLFTQIQNQQGPQTGPQNQNQSQPAAPSSQQFFISPPAAVSQVSAQPQTSSTTAGQPATQIFVPVSSPNSAIQSPSAAVSSQPVSKASASSPGSIQTPLPPSQSTKMEISANQQPSLQTSTVCNKSRNEMNPQRFLQRSPENRASPQTSPNHQASNGPLNKQTFILQPASAANQPPKTREPPRYEEAVKQSRSMHLNNAAQVPTATSQHMDDSFDISVESGEIPPFLHQDPPGSSTKTHPVTASITTLPVNTASSRSPPQVQSAPPAASSPSAADEQSEAFSERTSAEMPPASDPRARGSMEESQGQSAEQQQQQQQLYVPMDTSDSSFPDSAPSSPSFDAGSDAMEWSDVGVPQGSVGPPGFPAEFSEPHDMQSHFD